MLYKNFNGVGQAHATRSGCRRLQICPREYAQIRQVSFFIFNDPYDIQFPIEFVEL